MVDLCWVGILLAAGEGVDACPVGKVGEVGDYFPAKDACVFLWLVCMLW